ncbi:putative superfamily III holin-X [Motilibacter peucedani]|uniref:Putative superfamily III holin-X n=1 Tax=Motilibacter peucedani TaxID=598650 RepID=A0A420XPU9_9ACTN|nr:phage holin family protein [Motilibacter peucedani]RKS75274.1 putative superfamily III holin-X [Motilibacter peucedani]
MSGNSPGAGGFLRGMAGDVLGMAGDVRGMVRSEVRGTVDELTGRVTGRARRAGKGAALLGGAGAMGALSLGTAAVLVLRVLEAVLPRRTAAFVATVLFGGAAAGLGAAGVAELKRSAARERPDTEA